MAAAFLGTLANAQQVHLVAITANGLDVHGRDFGIDVEAALAWAGARNTGGGNVYWTVNRTRPGLNNKPKKSDIIAARFAHVDIDPPKTGGTFDKAEIVAAIEDIDAPPSFIIDSGGGLQAFWRFDGEAANLPAIEALNVQIRDMFDADACQNIDRLMRLPGTVNWPDRRKLARGRTPVLATLARDDDGTVYEPGELAASFPPAIVAATSAPIAIEVLDDFAPVDADALRLSQLDPLRSAIEHPPGQDRSGDALAAARLMANVGHDDTTIIGVLLNPANRVSAHCLEQRDARRAAVRCIARVRADGPSVADLPVPGHVYFDPATIVANATRQAVTVAPEPTYSVPAGLPAWRRDCTGALGMFVDHVTRTAPSPQPWVTLGGALAMFGTIAGRRYAGPTGVRTNIYSIGLIDSGGGKDWPLRQVTRLMVEADCAKMIGGEVLASGAGMISAIEASPSILFPIDEIGFVIKAAANRERAPAHKVEIVDTLTRFYSQAADRFLGTEYANKKERPRQVIEQPCMSVFGLTTPGVFWGALSSDNVLDGSLARMLIFASECHYPDLQDHVGNTAAPDGLIEAARAVKAGAEGWNAFPLGEGPSATPRPYTAPYASASATARARDMAYEQLAQLRDPSNEPYRSIIARLAQNAFKIALVKAICDHPAAPTIEARDLDWGYLVASQSVDALRSAVRERVADNDSEAQRKRLFRIVADAGSAGIDHERLARSCQFIKSRRDLGDALQFLEEAGRIRVGEIPRSDGKVGGRARKIYYDVD